VALLILAHERITHQSDDTHYLGTNDENCPAPLARDPQERLMNPVRTLACVSLFAACAWIVSGASAATAMAASCTYTNAAPLFAPWGDDAAYTPFQGSTFENGASGWSWGNGANIISGDNNPLLTAAGSHAVQIPGGGTARSPWLCVNSTTPSMRFFLRRVSGTGNLTIKALVNSGGNQLTTITTIASTTADWQPSPVIGFPALITASTTGVNAQIQFSADPGTTFRIDDIELDPYLRR